MNANHYAVIMAGGKGTRFWPLSRSYRPKHLLQILSRKSLIRETAARVVPLFGPKQTLVVTVAEHVNAVRRELAILPKANFLVESQGRNTAPCIGLAAIELLQRSPDAVMTVFPADHWIENLHSFARTLKVATGLAQERDALVTIGIRPGYAETGYGYILKGKKIPAPGAAAVYRVKGFQEKPPREKALRLLKEGSLWNSGIFAWKASTILSLLQRFSPQVYQGLKKIEAARSARQAGEHKLSELVAREYKKMPSVSIDYAVLEKAGSEGKVMTVEGDFGWSDVGSWAALHRMLPQDTQGNSGRGRWLALKSKGCFVYSPHRLIALLGMQDAVVVDTPDALLIGDIKRAQEVKDLVDELERKGYRRYTVK